MCVCGLLTVAAADKTPKPNCKLQIEREVHQCKLFENMMYLWQYTCVPYLENYDTQLSFGLSGKHFSASYEFCWQIRSFWTGFYPQDLDFLGHFWTFFLQEEECLPPHRNYSIQSCMKEMELVKYYVVHFVQKGHSVPHVSGNLFLCQSTNCSQLIVQTDFAVKETQLCRSSQSDQKVGGNTFPSERVKQDHRRMNNSTGSNNHLRS